MWFVITTACCQKLKANIQCGNKLQDQRSDPASEILGLAMYWFYIWKTCIDFSISFLHFLSSRTHLSIIDATSSPTKTFAVITHMKTSKHFSQAQLMRGRNQTPPSLSPLILQRGCTTHSKYVTHYEYKILR